VRLGQPMMKRRLNSRVEMAKALALLMTLRIVPKEVKKKKVSDLIVTALCKVDYYECGGERVEVAEASRYSRRRLVSLGFSHRAIIAMVKAERPNANVTDSFIWFVTTSIRKGTYGYEGQLPDKRPRSKKGN
ncbi:MAG: hypothetical protein ACREGR_02135, partial [Minisyncoccia bacterium]